MSLLPHRTFFVLVLALTSAVAAQSGAMPVRVAPVTAGELEVTRPLVATVEPVMQTILAAEQEGRVESRDFDEGEFVEAGHVLAAVDTDLLELNLRAAEAAVTSAEAELQQAELARINAQREAQRQARLYERSGAPEKEYLDAQTAAETAVAEVTYREAQLAQRRATVAELSERVQRAQSRAPFAGRVARRYVEVGQWLRPGDPVAELVQLDPLYVRVDVPESVIGLVRKGDSARVQVSALGDE